MSKKVVRILRLLIELRYKYLFQFSIVIVERGSKLEVGENTKIIKSIGVFATSYFSIVCE